jgi:pyridoxine kinase
MADDGELYACYDPSMIKAMRALIAKADIISPNFTEACFLADLDPHEADRSGFMQELCDALHSLGAKEVIITSTPTPEGHAVLYSAGYGAMPQSHPYLHIPCYYTGTGDIFSTLVLAYTLKGVGRDQAITLATGFISRVIQYSVERGRDGRAGVLLHEMLPEWGQTCGSE